MKKHRNYLFILLLSCLPLVFFFSNSTLFHTHDGLVHLPRMGAYYKALLDGQFPVRFAGDLNYGYGMPLFNFIYQLPYVVSSLFLLLGQGLVTSFKLTLALSFLLSGIFMYAFSKAYFKNDKTAFLVTVFYQFAPFRFEELLIRASFGEVYTYTFLPLVLYAIVKVVYTNHFRYLLLLMVATALLVLSHNAISLVFFAVCFGFIFFLTRDIKKIAVAVYGLTLGLMLAGFYWIPAVFEHKFTYGDLFMKNLYKEHFAPLQNFFIPNFTNIKVLQTGGISVQFGLFHTIALILAISLISKNKLENNFKKILVYSLILFFVSLFFMQPVSQFLWEKISLLRQFQFPWRFLSVVTFATAIFAVAYLFNDFFKKKVVYILLIFLTIISTAYYWLPTLGVDKIDEKFYWNFPLNTTYYGETDVIWSEGPMHSYPKKRIDIIGGKGRVESIVKKSHVHTYTVHAETDMQIVDKTQYFPGWRVINGTKQIPIEFQDPNWRGQITFRLPAGEHKVKVMFTETPLRLGADMLSLLSVVALLPIFIFRKKLL